VGGYTQVLATMRPMRRPRVQPAPLQLALKPSRHASVRWTRGRRCCRVNADGRVQPSTLHPAASGDGPM